MTSVLDGLSLRGERRRAGVDVGSGGPAMSATELQQKLPLHKRRWFQYSLRTLLALTLLASIGLSWLAVKMQRAERQRKAIETVEERKGTVTFADEDVADPFAVPRRQRKASAVASDRTRIHRDDSGSAKNPREASAVASERKGIATAEDVNAPNPFGSQTKAGSASTLRSNTLQDLLGGEYSGTVTRVNLWARTVADDDLTVLKNLPQLRDLELGATAVSDAGVRHLKDLVGLERLGLVRTSVTDEGLVYVAALANLKELNIDGTQVTDQGLVHVVALTNLKVLHINGTQVTDQGLAHLERLTKLTGLGVNSTQITDNALAYIGKMKQIQSLDLAGTRIQGTGFRHLAKLKDLVSLDIGGNAIDPAHVAELGGLPKLEWLAIGLPEVTEQTPAYFKQFKSLKLLWVRDPTPSENDLEKLRQALPGVRILSPTMPAR